MFGRVNLSRWTFLFAIVLALALGDGTRLGRSQVGAPASSSLPNLTGKWKLDTGETIDITQDNAGGVTAKFSPVVPCWDLPRANLFKGRLQRTGSGAAATVAIEGEFSACTRNERMWKECGVQKLFVTKFKATVTPFSITGENLRPGYHLPDGDYRRCTPDSSYEGWAPFSLTPLCRPSTPWFDKGANCQDAQSPEITIGLYSVMLNICGSLVFQQNFPTTNSPLLEPYAARLKTEVTRQIGAKVCCDAFRNADRTAGRCNPTFDIDCDGTPNLYDATPGTPGSPETIFPDISVFSTAPGAFVAPFPAGLNPDDPGFVPNASGCDCKWQLIKGVLNCGTGGQGHSYVATWKCPTNGREVTTTKNATAATPCP